MRPILSRITRRDLIDYLSLCAQVAPLDQAQALTLTLDAIRHHKHPPITPPEDALSLLQQRWYESLRIGTPDYSVYANPYYFCEVWLCWIIYSRKYLCALRNPKSMQDRSIVEHIGTPATILDLGCGFGYTTAGLKELFPQSEVVGTNLEGTAQYAMAAYFGSQHGFKLAGSYEGIHADLIFASEYFEHISNPVEHLRDVLASCTPSRLLIANTFTSPAIGHFETYTDGEATLTGAEASRLFNDTLRDAGFTKQKTNCWNNRPTYWSR